MATSNFKTQQHFDLYATDNFLIYPYKIDPATDDFILDETGEPIIDYDTTPDFDYTYFDDCKAYTNTKLNSQLTFFEITFEDGYYSGIQTFIKSKYPNDLDSLDYLKFPQYYDPQQLFKDFGYNTYILKRKILKEIKLINNTLLPQLKENYLFDKLCVVAQFSNGETFYKKF